MSYQITYLGIYSLKEYNVAEIMSPSPVHKTPNNGTCLKDILEAEFSVKTMVKSGHIFLSDSK